MGTNAKGIKEMLATLGFDKKASLYILLIVKIFALIAHRNEILPQHYLTVDSQNLPDNIAVHFFYKWEIWINFAINVSVELGLCVMIFYTGYKIFKS